MSEELDLDAELSELESVVSAEADPQPEPQSSPQNQLETDIRQLLESRDDKPTQEQIEAWKAKHGQDAVQLISLDSDNVYIYTHITLGQWERVQTIMQDAQQKGMAQQVEKRLKKKVVKSAVLWPKLTDEFFENSRAGLLDTLYQLILVQSYFLTPQQAMTLTVQL